MTLSIGIFKSVKLNTKKCFCSVPDIFKSDQQLSGGLKHARSLHHTVPGPV